jgi:gliding motility-associated lipoprotein GldD
MKKLSFCFLAALFFIACSHPIDPKRRGYYKINLPVNQGNKLYNIPGFPYKFEYPSYAEISKDSSFFDTKPENDYWLNIDVPSLDARLYISYKTIAKSGKNSFDSLLMQTTTMSFKHSSLANGIEPKPFKTTNGIDGVFFDVSGDVATSKQFFLTDSVKHFFRGALYFNAAPNNDSLKPVYDFLEKDLNTIANTLQWNY